MPRLRGATTRAVPTKRETPEMEIKFHGQSCFELTEGDFLFLEGAAAGDDAVKLPGKVRDLVLEGVKRSEQVQLWRAKIGATSR